MADPFLSLNEYVCDGIKTQFEISFAGGYLSRDHVVAIVADGKDANGNLINEVQVDFLWVSEYSVSISPAVSASKILRIYRNTPFNAPIVDFSDGSVITEATLDINAKQAVFLAAELRDRFGTVVDPALTAVYATEAKAARDDILNEVTGLVSTAGAGRIGLSNSVAYPVNTVGSSLNRFFNFTNPTFELQSIGPSTPPANGVYMATGGNALSFFTLVSSPSDGAEFDNQRATMLIRAVTSDDGNSEEQSLCILTTIQTGYTTPWAAGTPYSTLGTNVNNGGNTYRLIQAGTSAGSGGPTGKTTNILDGTCRWMWINDSAINAKCGFYNETLVLPGAGSSWAQANNLEIKPGVLANFIVSQENDLTNNCGIDSTIGGLNKYNTYLQNNGGNVSSSVLDIGSSNSTNFSSIWGLHLTGAKLASNSVIGIDASSANGIGIGTGFGGAINPTFTVAAIGDSSTAPTGLSITGNKANAGVEVTATTPASYVSAGTKTFAGFYDAATSPRGVYLQGAYSSAAIEVTGVTPTALNIGGVKSLAGIRDGSTSPRGLLLEGTYSKSPIRMASLPPAYADDAAAATGGLLVGDVYRTGSTLKVRAV